MCNFYLQIPVHVGVAVLLSRSTSSTKTKVKDSCGEGIQMNYQWLLGWAVLVPSMPGHRGCYQPYSITICSPTHHKQLFPLFHWCQTLIKAKQLWATTSLQGKLVSLEFVALVRLIFAVLIRARMPSATISPLSHTRRVCVLVRLRCIRSSVQPFTLDAFWVRHSAGLLESWDQRGPAVIKEFTKGCVI